MSMSMLPRGYPGYPGCDCIDSLAVAVDFTHSLGADGMSPTVTRLLLLEQRAAALHVKKSRERCICGR